MIGGARYQKAVSMRICKRCGRLKPWCLCWLRRAFHLRLKRLQEDLKSDKEMIDSATDR